MACINNSLGSLLLLTNLPSYGLIGLITIGLILYFAYVIIISIRNQPTSSSSVYVYFSQISLFFLLLCPITFLFRPSVATSVVCPIQTLSLQILPFSLLLGYNVHFAYEWLLKLGNAMRKSVLIALSSFLIFFLAILIQTAILLVWFYNSNQTIVEPCSDECRRPLFLCSLVFNFVLLFLYSLQSSLRYHFNNQAKNFIYLLTSLLALCVTIVWICLYLFLPSQTSSHIFYTNNSYILAYGTVAFVYTFLVPFLYEQCFYHQQRRVDKRSDARNQINKMTFKCLSLTKEQQRVFMAAYIKRNLTASCENLTGKTTRSTSQQANPTRHSTLSVESLCPTLISTVSSESPPVIVPLPTTDSSSCGTATSEYLLLSTSMDMK